MGISFFSWCLVYLFAVIRGFKDKTNAIPLPAIMANVTWELLYSTILRHHSPIGSYIPAVWAVLDVPILLQAIFYWTKEIQRGYLALHAFSLGVSFLLCAGIFYFSEKDGVNYIKEAFCQNLMMSILFLNFIVSRNDLRGQSFYIALIKAVGTGSAIACAIILNKTLNGINAITYFSIIFFDCTYIILLHRKFKTLDASFWRRL